MSIKEFKDWMEYKKKELGTNDLRNYLLGLLGSGD
jgi:hypothetical protein